MPYEILKHTADLRMRVWADTLKQLFEDAVLGMMGIMSLGPRDKGQGIKRGISIRVGDRTALLVDFLNEVLSLAQIKKEIFSDVKIVRLSETEIEAELGGVPVDEFDEDIKAVTYHEADVRQNEKGEWETMLVFDI